MCAGDLHMLHAFSGPLKLWWWHLFIVSFSDDAVRHDVQTVTCDCGEMGSESLVSSHLLHSIRPSASKYVCHALRCTLYKYIASDPPRMAYEWSHIPHSHIYLRYVHPYPQNVTFKLVHRYW